MISKYSHFIQGDRVIWFAVVMLSIFGMLAVYSSTGTLAYKLQDGNTEYFLVLQLGMAAIGLILMWFFHFLPYRLFAQNIFSILWIEYFLTHSCSFCNDINDARRWVKVFGISFQVSDFAKVTLVMYLARYLSLKQDTSSLSKKPRTAIAYIVGICFQIEKHE